jgi:hypothetical protein
MERKCSAAEDLWSSEKGSNRESRTNCPDPDEAPVR